MPISPTVRPPGRTSWGLTCLLALTACAGGPAPVTPSLAVDYAPPLAEPARTQVLVLGTVHLYEAQGCLAPTSLDAVIARLSAWRPDVIAVESLPATTLDSVEHRDDDFAADVREFAQRTLDAGRIAGDALHVSPAQARREAAPLIASAAPSAAQRVHLVMLLIAGHEYPSAVLQWSYLSDAERTQADLPTELRTRLETSRTAADEAYRIAVPVAQRLGLPQLAQVDDFAGEEAYTAHSEQLRKELEASGGTAKVENAPLYQEMKARLSAACRDPQQLLGFYRWINDHAYGKADVALQWGMWFRTHFASGLDRARYAGWEARNLGIAANIRKESSLFAGKRVLVIYGAAHKPFLDAYLAQMLDVRVVQPAAVLGEWTGPNKPL